MTLRTIYTQRQVLMQVIYFDTRNGVADTYQLFRCSNCRLDYLPRIKLLGNVPVNCFVCLFLSAVALPPVVTRYELGAYTQRASIYNEADLKHIETKQRMYFGLC